MLDILASTALAMPGQILGYHGQQMTNRSNETIAKDATSANMEDAQRNRDFQAAQSAQQMAYQTAETDKARKWEESMANSAHQRQVADLKKAGLNPILAVNSGAATPSVSAPSGASASGAQGQAATTTLQNPMTHLSGLFTTALDAMSKLKGMDRLDAETALLKGQTSKIPYEQRESEARTKLHQMDTKVRSKDVPRADLTNKAYNFIGSILEDMNNMRKSSAKEAWEKQKNQYNKRPYAHPLTDLPKTYNKP